MAADDGVRDDRAHRQRQARALGDPTRFAIFCHVLDAAQPVRVAALTQHFRLNHNAVRQHLAKLVDAGLLEERIAPRGGPGRPALEYSVAADAVATWAAQSPYQQLALLLVDVASGNGTPLEVGAAAGRAIAVTEGEDPLVRLTQEMGRLGFRPRMRPLADAVEVVLEHCPFETAAAVAPEIVCSLHQGLADGMLEALGSDYEVEELVARDPSAAGCRLQLRPAPPAV